MDSINSYELKGLHDKIEKWFNFLHICKGYIDAFNLYSECGKRVDIHIDTYMYISFVLWNNSKSIKKRIIFSQAERLFRECKVRDLTREPTHNSKGSVSPFFFCRFTNQFIRISYMPGEFSSSSQESRIRRTYHSQIKSSRRAKRLAFGFWFTYILHYKYPATRTCQIQIYD